MGAAMSNTKVIDNLRRVEIFTGLVDAELLKVAELCTAVRVPAGKTIFKEGDGGDELYIIHEGSVRVMINTRADDGTFLRRVRLDITGTLPSSEETRRFLADPDPKKRERLVDRLLIGPEFLAIWGTSWLEVLRV